MDQEILTWVACGLCLMTGLAAVGLRPKILLNWCFFIGMVLLAAERLLEQKAFDTVVVGDDISQIGGWLVGTMWINSLMPVFWLTFSLMYARGNASEFLNRWKWLLLVATVFPTALMLGAMGPLLVFWVDGKSQVIQFSATGKIWLLLLLMVTLGILTNFEKTFRASVGMTRWRIKYMFLGMAMIFGVKIYILSQFLLFSAYDPSLSMLATLGVILGCCLIVIGHFRSGLGTVDLYPSRAILQGSLTIILAGVYFLIVGVLAQVVAMMGGIKSFSAQALVVLLALVGLTILLLSDRLRLSLQRFVSRHFQRAERDYRKIWTEFTQCTSSVLDVNRLGVNAAEVICENFHLLGVTMFRVATDDPMLVCLSSTEEKTLQVQVDFDVEWMSEVRGLVRPFNLENQSQPWAEVLRKVCPTKFAHGGDRLVIPLVASEQLVGLIVLADRVNGAAYSHEEIDLLGCIGNQLAAAFLTSSLTEKVLQAKELEAFQTISTFFVHDLKNAANSLNLTLQNLPIYFDDPEFRVDAVKTVGRTVERINQMITKLSSLRHELQLRRVPTRLDVLCKKLLDQIDAETKNTTLIERDLQPVAEVSLDPEAMHSVLTNLVVNARESMTSAGVTRVATRMENGKLLLTVADEGGGMSPEFIKNQLFRPFHSTKTKGLGIGLFQCKKIVEAHQGNISVASTVGFGTCFTILFPATTDLTQDMSQ